MKKKVFKKKTSIKNELKVNSNSFFNYYINSNKLIRTIGFTTSLTLFLFAILSIFPIVNHNNKAEATPGVVEVPTISITSVSNMASVDIVPTSSTGTFATSSSSDRLSFDVTTSNYTGYTLTIEAADDNGLLTNSNTADTLSSITTATDATTFATGSTSDYNNKWGYKPNIFNSAENTNYLPSPTTTASTLNHTTTANTSSDSYTIDLGARVDYTKPSGTYTNTYILTATANPVAYAINYYDGINSTAIATQASSTNTAASITLNPTYTSGSAPTRSTYTFKSWCLGTVNSTTTYNTSTKAYSNQATVCAGTEYATGANMPIDPTVDNTDIKLYAVWTPTTFAQAYGSTAMTMQNMTSAICDKVTINQYATLTDNRDNQAYTIGKLEDGRCWMADNLNLDAYTYRNSLTASNTHADGTVGSTALTRFKSGGGSTSDRYATGAINSVNSTSGNWTASYSYSVPLASRSGKCDPNINGSYQCLSPYQNANYTYNTVINKYGTPSSDSSGTANITYNIGPGSYKIGTYYNYCAAALGSYCYGDGTSSGTSATGNATEADICPKGWRLPVGGNVATTNEYQILYNAISAKYSSTKATSTSPFSFQTMLSTPVSGFFNSATAYRQGAYGYFWSSSYYSATNMYYLLVAGTGVAPQYNSYRYNGYSVRCIAQ